MSFTQTATIQNSSDEGQHIIQDMPSDYTGIFALCGTVFIISIIAIAVAYKISEKWRLDAYKLKVEEIKQDILAMKDLSANLKKVKILLEGLVICGNNNINNTEQP